jgi:hypothetical protein
MENTMATLENLNTLKLTDAKRPKNQPPIVQRRNKLISKLWEQLELAKAKHSGKDFVIKRYKNVKDLEGNIKSIEKPKRIKPWWFTSTTGALCINVFYGSKVLELAKGKTAIEAANLENVIEVLELLKREAEIGTFDATIEAASLQLRSRFELKIPKTSQKSKVLTDSIAQTAFINK